MLQFILVLVMALRAVAQSNVEYRSVSKFLSGSFGTLVLWLVVSTAINLAGHWDETELHDVIALFLVPVWLTLVTVPFIYVLALVAGYGLVFLRMACAREDSRLSWATRAGVVRELLGRLRDIDQFTDPWTRQAGWVSSYSEARQVVRNFKLARAAEASAAAATQQRLLDNAGVQGADDEGRRLDQREFKETCDALQWLATCQMGWHQRKENGGRYRTDLLEILGNDFTRNGLPAEHGIVMRISDDGQAWYAYRRTVTGWVFAIGASEKPPSQWIYDGQRPPRGFPGRNLSWGKTMFAPHNQNW